MTRPQGVRIIRGDGTTTVCELAYTGRDDDDQHVWEAITEVNFGDGDRLHVDMLPANTTILLPTRDDERFAL